MSKPKPVRTIQGVSERLMSRRHGIWYGQQVAVLDHERILFEARGLTRRSMTKRLIRKVYYS